MNKRKWQSVKKNLPKNWAQEVSRSLHSKGLQLSPSQVSDIKRGKVKDIELKSAVLKEILSLSASRKRKIKSVSELI